MTGDGGVLKRRLQEGEGEFPVDCPLHDTTVRLHYRVRSLAGDTPGPWLYDSRTHRTDTSSTSSGNSANSTSAAAGGVSAPPLEVDTGCGELPEGLELVVKLMVPGELASATCTPHYAYEVRAVLMGRIFRVRSAAILLALLSAVLARTAASWCFWPPMVGLPASTQQQVCVPLLQGSAQSRMLLSCILHVPDHNRCKHVVHPCAGVRPPCWGECW